MITKKNPDLSRSDFLQGEAILIDKDAGLTSFDAVYRVRKAIGVRKVGHAGTLDPLATGLLIICTGKMTKQIDSYQAREKRYQGIICLGKTTPSFDAETEVVSECDYSGITADDIEKTRLKFLGNILQTPPMYSAIKHNGKALYKIARKGGVIERAPREVSIFNFSITRLNLPELFFDISCSKGTYLRVIADDFGRALGCGAYLKSLRRTEIGEYSVQDALRVSEFEDLVESEKDKKSASPDL